MYMNHVSHAFGCCKVLCVAVTTRHRHHNIVVIAAMLCARVCLHSLYCGMDASTGVVHHLAIALPSCKRKYMSRRSVVIAIGARASNGEGREVWKHIQKALM
eukprot:594775-Amphidinium_carterae.1